MGISHSWNGTILTITSDSGTSSADLKGDTGIRGPQGPAGISLGGGGDVDLTGYATETFVTDKIAEAQLSGGEVDLSNYVTKTDLDTSVDTALTEAKQSGEFDGKGIASVNNEVSFDAYGNYSYKYTFNYTDGTKTEFTIKDGENGADGEDGVNGSGFILYDDTTYSPNSEGWVNNAAFTNAYTIKTGDLALKNNGDVYLVTDSGPLSSRVEYLYCIKGADGAKGDTGAQGEKGDKGDTGEKGADGAAGAKGDKGDTGPQGPKGDTGANGLDGYNPVKGVDYWTTEDKQDITDYIDNEIAENVAQGLQQYPLFVSTIEECTDTSKIYVLPDGYIYAYMYGETSGISYTNKIGTVNINKRYNSSNTLRDATGYAAVDYITVAANDVIRIKPASAVEGVSGGYQRVKFFDSSNTVIDKLGNQDAPPTQMYKVTYEDDVACITAGYYNSTNGNDSTNTLAPLASNIAKMRMNLYVSGSTITEADVKDFIVTINEPIQETTISGYSWQNTGLPFIPADYEDRIVAIEDTQDDLEAQVNVLNSKVNNLNVDDTLLNTVVFAPAPQEAADGTGEFNADSMTADDIYNYIDAVVTKYPSYIVKETMGKDESGKYDVNRYVLSRKYYKAWCRDNYPSMYAWTNGSTTIYSTSVSPRIGDNMYTYNYVGAVYNTVSAVNNANSSRTVNNLVFTRNTAKDVKPTLVYTSILSESTGNAVYNVSKSQVTTISSIGDTLVGANGITYNRYPLGDRDNAMNAFRVVTIGANEHGPTGDPREPAIVVARLIKDLAENRYMNNAFLNYLKNSVMLVFIPVINPFGFNYGSNDSSLDGYYNVNNVNINRNYDTPGWGNDTTAGGQGAYGGSEIETQYFMNSIYEPKAEVAISVHCLGSNEANKSFTHYQGNGFTTSKLRAIAEVMYNNYNLKFTDYGTTPPETSAKSPSYISYAGAKGGIIEMNMRDIVENKVHTANILEADYTLLLQCLNMWLTD